LDLIIAMSEKKYAKLRPGVQKALVSAVGDAGIFCSELAGRQTETDLENLSSKYGIPVIQPDFALWRSTFRHAISKICQDGLLDPDLYKTIQNI